MVNQGVPVMHLRAISVLHGFLVQRGRHLKNEKLCPAFRWKGSGSELIALHLNQSGLFEVVYSGCFHLLLASGDLLVILHIPCHVETSL